MITLHQPLDYAKCFATIRALRRPDKTSCCQCRSQAIITQGKNNAPPERQRYSCKACQRKIDDLTGTIFADHHQPLIIRMLCLYFMGFNLSNTQIDRELVFKRSGCSANGPTVVFEDLQQKTDGGAGFSSSRPW
jgi:transposase-like protein